MSRNVDERVVEMKFDNAQFEKNVKNSMTSIDELKKSLDFTGVGNTIIVVGQKFSALEHIAIGALRRMGQEAYETGKKLIKSLTVDQISVGWEKFAEKTTSVQTIMAATRESWEESANAMARATWLMEHGVDKSVANSLSQQATNIQNGVMTATEAIEKSGGKATLVMQNLANRMGNVIYQGDQMRFVSEQLERLNWFTDETSYRLVDMANNIGKFTSAGVGLDKAVSAMEGIATWAAISGGNANSASIAMYNMSQALGSGAVLAVDWKSIENQNMATAEFKQIVVETAAELGTLNKVSEGLYETLEGNEVTVKNFRENLKDRWFSDEVLMGSLQKYGDFAVELQQVAAETDLSAKELLDSLTAYKDASGGMADYLINEGINDDLANGMAERYKQIASGMMTMEEAAEELQTTPAVISNLTKRLDGFMDGAVDFEAMLEEIKETCPDTTLTIEDLRKEFNHLTDDTMDLGMRAFKAAQEAKTFQEAVDYVREAVSTGWLKTFEKIFGNYEEAKELWSNLAEEFYTLFVEAGDIRNSILDTWKKAGGRNDLVESFWNIFHAIMAVVDAVKGAIKEVFNPILSDEETGASRLWEWTRRLKEFSETLKLTDDETGELNKTGQKIKSTFKGLFAIFGIIGDVLKALIKPVFKLIPGIGSMSSGILDATASFGDMLVALRETINSSEFLEELTNRLSGAAHAVSNFIIRMRAIFIGFSYFRGGGGIGGVIASIFDTVINVVTLGFDVISALMGKDLTKIRDNVTNAIATARDFIVNELGPTEEILQNIKNGFSTAISKIKETFESLRDIDLSGATNFSDKIKTIFDGLSDKIEKVKEFFTKIAPYVGGFVKVIGAIFYGIGLVLGEVGRKISNFLKDASLKDILDFIVGLSQAFLNFKLGSFLKSITTFSETSKNFLSALKEFTEGLKESVEKFGNKVLKFAISMAILAGAVYILSTIDIPKMIAAGTAIATLMYLMSVVTKDMGKAFDKDQKFNSGTKQILAFSVAIFILASSLKKISGIDPISMATSVAAIGVLMLTLYGIMDMMGKRKDKNIGSGLEQLMALAAAILILSFTMKQIGDLRWDQIGKSLVVIGALMAGLTVSMKVLAKAEGQEGQALGDVAYLITFANAIKKLVAVMEDIGTMPWSTIKQGLIGITVLMAELVLAMKIMSTSSKGARGMVAASVALLMLVGVIKLMSLMSWETIGKGLLAIALALTTLAISAAVCKPVINVIVKLGKSLWKIGVGMLALAAALVVFSVAAPLFMVGAKLIAKGLLILLTELITAIPQLISALVQSIYQSAEDIVEFVVAVIHLVCSALRSSASDIVDTIMELIMLVLDGLASNSEGITSALLDILIVGPIRGIADKIPDLAQSLKSVFLALMDALTVFGNGDLLASLGAIDILRKIVWKLTVISTMAWLATSSLPKIGLKLSEFGENSKPFFRAIRIVTPDHLRASKSLAEMLVIMTSAGIKDALTSWFTGKERLSELGKQLADFAPYFKVYARNVRGMNAQDVINSADALEAMANVWVPYMDSQPFSVLGEGMDYVGSSLKTYGSNVQGLPASDVIASADAITALSSALYNMQLIDPEAVASFGKSLKDYGDAVDGMKTYAVKLSLEPAQALINLDAGVKNQSWNLFKGKRNLGDFGENLKSFGAALKDYGDAVDGMKTYVIKLSIEPAQALIDLDAGVKNQSWNLFKGKRNLGDFGENLKSFGVALKDYGDAVDGVKTYAIQLSVDVAQALIDLDAGVKNQSWNLFKGDRTGEAFGKNLTAFGQALRDYGDSVDGMKTYAIQLSIEPANWLISLDESVNNQSWNLFKGKRNLGDFGANVSSFGQALRDYGDAVDGLKTYAIQLSIEPAQTLIALDEGVNNQSWNLFKGERNLGAFGENLKTFGQALRDYGDSVDGLKSYSIGLSIDPAKELIALDEGITNQSWNLFKGERNLGAFGDNLKSFGTALKDYGDAVDGMKTYAIQLSIEPAQALMELAKMTPENDFNSWLFGKDNLSSFGSTLASFGESLGSFSDSLSNVDTTVFARVRTGLNILTSIKTEELESVLMQMGDLLDLIFSIDTYDSGGNVEALATSLSNLANSGIDGLIEAFENPEKTDAAIDTFISNLDSAVSDKHGEIEDMAEALAKAFINEMAIQLRGGKSDIGQAVSQLASHIRTYRYQFYKAGEWLVEGFAGGIDSSRWKAEVAGRAMVKKTFDAVKAEEDANSPSKKAMIFGGYLVDGFIKPVYDRINDLRKAGKTLASETLNATNAVIRHIADYMDSDMDTQPTIRPVLDLTDVTSGFSQLNTMFGHRQAVGINARMSDITAEKFNGDGSIISSGPSYNFVQNNYSPKALNAAEIYRQTENQFSRVKGRVRSR